MDADDGRVLQSFCGFSKKKPTGQDRGSLFIGEGPFPDAERKNAAGDPQNYRVSRRNLS